jgi:isopentenyl phosphate kinase
LGRKIRELIEILQVSVKAYNMLPASDQRPVGVVRRVIKLGGAAITVKERLETPRHDVLRAAAQHVAEAYRHVWS